MPRLSAEERAAAAFRSGITRRAPPPRLCAQGKRLWREIVDDRPVDFFRPGNFELLEQFCQLMVQLRGLHRQLKKAPPKEYAGVALTVSRLSATGSTLARQLRLTILSDMHRQSAKAVERGEGERDRLLGGAAVLRAVQ
jgi:hypothetical protein